MKKIKKYLAAVMAVALFLTGIKLSNIVSEAQTEEKPQLALSIDDYGVVTVSIPESEQERFVSDGNALKESYSILLRVGFHLQEFSSTGVSSPEYMSKKDLSRYIYKPGTYEISATIDSSMGFRPDDPVITFVVPDHPIDSPQNLQWNENSVLTWDAVPGAKNYKVYLKFNGAYLATGPIGTEEPVLDLEALTQKFNLSVPDGVYTAEVVAYPENLSLWCISNKSEPATYVKGGNNEQVGGILDDALERLEGIDLSDQEALEANRDKITAAVEGFKSQVDNSELMISMQTDDTVRQKLADLDNLYTRANNITVAPEIAEELGEVLDLDKISISGLGLNASTDDTVPFVVRPDNLDGSNEIKKDADGYIRYLAMEINVGELELSTPVYITMPIPKTIAPQNIRLYHYHTDESGNVYGKSTPLIIDHSAGTMTFVVDNFSTFLFVDSSSNEGDNSGSDEGGSGEDGEAPDQGGDSSGEGGSGSVSGSDAGYKWEPQTEDEIYRFSFKNSFPVEFTASTALDGTINMESDVQGEKWFQVLEAVKKDYQIGATYNIFLNNQKCSKTDSSVKIVLTIPENLYRDGRSYEMICVDEKGIPYTYKDEDNNPSTITFTTDRFYAYALCYKDQ